MAWKRITLDFAIKTAYANQCAVWVNPVNGKQHNVRGGWKRQGSQQRMEMAAFGIEMP
jgi:hypothetical protein